MSAHHSGLHMISALIVAASFFTLPLPGLAEKATDNTIAPHQKEGRMNSALECLDQMLYDYLKTDMVPAKFAEKWLGIKNAHMKIRKGFPGFPDAKSPCPEFFEADFLVDENLRTSPSYIDFYFSPRADVRFRDVQDRYGELSENRLISDVHSMKFGINSQYSGRVISEDYRWAFFVGALFTQEVPQAEDKLRILTVYRYPKTK